MLGYSHSTILYPHQSPAAKSPRRPRWEWPETWAKPIRGDRWEIPMGNRSFKNKQNNGNLMKSPIDGFFNRKIIKQWNIEKYS